MDFGIMLDGEVFTLVGVKSMLGLDENKDTMSKYYFKSAMSVPLSVLMRKRAKTHYLNVEDRVKNVYGRVSESRPAVSFMPSMLGVLGTVKRPEKNMIKFDVDREVEEAKVHDPYFAMAMLAEIHANKTQNATKESTDESSEYYTEQELEAKLGLPRGVVHKVTSSFTISYEEFGQEGRRIADIGLNIKNWSKKCHVPGLVRFAEGKPAVEEEKKETASEESKVEQVNKDASADDKGKT